MSEAAIDATLGLFPTHSLYIHIPFCAGKCSYCDFFSVPADLFSHGAYVRALLEQLHVWSEKYAAGPFDTIYMGGGTPTMLDKDSLATLIAGVKPFARQGCEWTIEANPESLSESILETLSNSPVNRISLGIQTLDPQRWQVLHRVGSIDESISALERLQKYHYGVSIDLLAGIPTSEGAQNNSTSIFLEMLELLSKQVQHISIYDLTLEPGTVLEACVASGKLHMPDSDELADLRQSADALLRNLGFIRYEVSNYARPNCECKHNASYWNMEPYLGIGSGAVSTLHLYNKMDQEHLDSMQRFTGTKNINTFIDHPAALPEGIETIDRITALFEVLMMGFRTIRGVDTERIASQFGVQISEIIPSTLQRWKQRIIWKNKRISLNPRYFDILNRFLVECLDELS